MIKKISVITPVYNEERSLKKNFSKIYKFLFNNFSSFEIILIESGSSDKSNLLCKKYEKLKNVKLFVQKNREGFGSAIKLGIKKISGEFFCVLPIDLCFNLSELAILNKKKFDLLTSYRIIDNRNILRKLQSYIYNIFIKIIFGLNFKSINSLPKIYKSSFIKKKKLYSKGGTIDAEILFHFKKKNKQEIIPVKFINRKYGSSKIKLLDIINIVIDALIVRLKIALF